MKSSKTSATERVAYISLWSIVNRIYASPSMVIRFPVAVSKMRILTSTRLSLRVFLLKTDFVAFVFIVSLWWRLVRNSCITELWQSRFTGETENLVAGLSSATQLPHTNFSFLGYCFLNFYGNNFYSIVFEFWKSSTISLKVTHLSVKETFWVVLLFYTLLQVRLW